jgi:hypothetical protein
MSHPSLSEVQEALLADERLFQLLLQAQVLLLACAAAFAHCLCSSRAYTHCCCFAEYTELHHRPSHLESCRITWSAVKAELLQQPNNKYPTQPW